MPFDLWAFPPQLPKGLHSSLGFSGDAMLTAETVRKMLNYDPDTGVFYWLKRRNKVQIGDVAGSKDYRGYIRIRLYKKRYMAHRLAWLFVHGNWPVLEIDHINGICDDNRLSNLREATRAQNTQNKRRQQNNTSGFKGVHFNVREKRFQADIKARGTALRLGFYDTAEEAYRAYCEAAHQLHGEFARLK